MTNNMYEKFKIALQLINDVVPDDDICTIKQSQRRLKLCCLKLWLLGSTGNVLFKQDEWVSAIHLHSFSWAG